MMSLDTFKASIMTLILVVLILAALALALDSFQVDMGNDVACTSALDVLNTTTRHCVNGTLEDNPAYGETTTAFNATQEGLTGTLNASSYLSTIGTLIGVAALIAVVVAAFMFVRR
jgi:hypothetical protein